MPSLWNGFIHDDRLQIVNNPQVQSWDYLSRLLTTHLWSQRGGDELGYYYRPLFSVWMLLVDMFAGLSPWIWHLSSILLHVGATYLVFRLCLELLANEGAACVGAALFAIHPIHVDAVSWISASNEILFTIFTLWALLFGTRASRDSGKNEGSILLSALFFGAALFAKETAVAVLPLFPVLRFLFARDDATWRKRVLASLRFSLPYVTAIGVYFSIRLLVLQRIGVETGKHDWQKVFLSSLSIIAFYLKKLVWPVGLSGFYMNPLLSSPTLGMWISLLGILAGIALVIWLSFRYSTLIGFSGLLVLLPLLPVLIGLRVYDQGNMTHDRYLYLPSVGLSLLLGLAAKQMWPSTVPRRAFIGAVMAMAGFYAYLTFVQQKFYIDDEAFYKRGIAVAPDNVLVIDYLGNLYLRQGRTNDALKQFETAYRLSPDDPNVKFAYARGFFETQQYGAAEPIFKELANPSVIKNPRRRALILLSLGNDEIRLKKLDAAEQTLRSLDALDSEYPTLHRTLGTVFQMEGRLAEAQAEYRKEFEVSGDTEARRQAMVLAQYLRSRNQ